MLLHPRCRFQGASLEMSNFKGWVLDVDPEDGTINAALWNPRVEGSQVFVASLAPDDAFTVVNAEVHLCLVFDVVSARPILNAEGKVRASLQFLIRGGHLMRKIDETVKTQFGAAYAIKRADGGGLDVTVGDALKALLLDGKGEIYVQQDGRLCKLMGDIVDA